LLIVTSLIWTLRLCCESRSKNCCLKICICHRLFLISKSWFTYIGVLNSFYHQWLLTTNCLGCQPTTVCLTQLHGWHMAVLVAAAIRCRLSDCAIGKKFMVMISEDVYHGMLYPSIMIDSITPDATALIYYTLGAKSLPLVLICHNWYTSIALGTPQHELAIEYWFPHYRPPSFLVFLLYDGWSLISSSPPNGTIAISSQTLDPPTNFTIDGGAALLNSHSSIPISTAWLRFTLSMSFHAPSPASVLRFSTVHFPSGSLSFLLVNLFFPHIRHITFPTPFWFRAS